MSFLEQLMTRYFHDKRVTVDRHPLRDSWRVQVEYSEMDLYQAIHGPDPGGRKNAIGSLLRPLEPVAPHRRKLHWGRRTRRRT